MKRSLMSLLLAAACSFSLCACSGNSNGAVNGTNTSNTANEASQPEVTEESLYSNAVEFLKQEDYSSAIPILRDLGDYNDAKELLREASISYTKKYIEENGKSYKPVDLVDKTYEKALSVDKNDKVNDGKAECYLALDDSGNIVVGSDFNYGNTYGKSISDFEITLEPGKTTVPVQEIISMGILDAYTIEGATGTIDLTTYKSDIEPVYSDIYQKNRKTGSTNVTEKKLAQNECILIGTGTFAEMRSEASIAIDELLSDIGVTAYDLGFDAFKKEETQSSSASASGSADGTLVMENARGKIEYAGWSYAPENMYTKCDPDHAVLVYFDYTNYEDAEKQCQKDFWITAYQNGVELDDPGSYHSGVSKEKENYFKNVLKDGKIRIADGYQIEDHSPLTIIVKDQKDSNNSMKFTIDLE